MEVSVSKANDIDSVALHRAQQHVSAGLAPGIDSHQATHLREKGSRVSLCEQKVKAGDPKYNSITECKCDGCLAEYDKWVLSRMAEEVRTYWNKPTAGEAIPEMERPVRNRVKYERVPLTTEEGQLWAPVGSGNALSAVGTFREKAA